jgi:hypothetical protein
MLQDFGYQVNYAAADAYAKPLPAAQAVRPPPLGWCGMLPKSADRTAGGTVGVFASSNAIAAVWDDEWVA